MDTHSTTGRSVNRTVATAFGAIYTLVGLAGFLVTGGDPVVSKDGESLLGFDVNVLHNLVHLAIGIALLVAGRRHETARAVNMTIGAVYLALGLLGPVINDTELDILGLNGADNFLHIASGAVLLGVALLADKTLRTGTGAGRTSV